MKPLVSIIIPVYNGNPYLKFAIDSALSQTYDNIEVIVVNDGSSDSGLTRDIASVYGDRIRYYEKENGGVASALNYAVTQSKGEYISWLSHDDVYYSIKIKEQIRYCQERNDSKLVVYSYQDQINEKGEVIREANHIVLDENYLLFQLLMKRNIGGCTLLLPRAIFHDLGLFDVSLKTVQDYAYWYKAIMSGYKFALCPIIAVSGRLHPGQESVWNAKRQKEEENVLFTKVISNCSLDQLAGRDSRKLIALIRLFMNLKLEGHSAASKSAAVRMLEIKYGRFCRRLLPFFWPVVRVRHELFGKVINFCVALKHTLMR